MLQSALERAYRRWPSIRQKDVPEAYVRKIIVTAAAVDAGRRRKFASAPLDEQQLPDCRTLRSRACPVEPRY